MSVIIAGMKREVNDEDSVTSQVEADIYDEDFFDDKN